MKIPSLFRTRRESGVSFLKVIGFILVSLAVLITLSGLFYAEEDWRGKSDWEKYRRDAEARGVELNWRKLIPPPVPDDQNFAMTPFLAPVLDLNPRPFAVPWRDTNGANRAMNFSRELMDLYQEQPAGQMTDLEKLATAARKELKLDREANISSRTDAAAFLLDYMKQYQPVLDELHTAAQRPYARFNVHYDDKDPASILLPHCAVVRRISMLLQIKASSELAEQKTDSAFEDVRLIFRLADSLRGEPILISQLVRYTILNSASQIVWEGIAGHRWSDAQLQTFQTIVGGMTILKDTRMALNAERAAFGGEVYDLMRADRHYLWSIVSYDAGQPDAAVILLGLAPSGWIYQEQIVHQRLLDEKLLPAFNMDATLIQPRQVEAFEDAIPKNEGPASLLLRHHVLARLLLPSLDKFCQKSAFRQANMDEAMIACALERYRLANGKLPDTLDALASQYLSKVPMDICTGQPLKYRSTDNSHFTLYSIGWNDKDDGGTVIMTEVEKKPIQDFRQGDWVWPAYVP